MEFAQIGTKIITMDRVHWHTFYSVFGDLNGLLGWAMRTTTILISKAMTTVQTTWH